MLVYIAGLDGTGELFFKQIPALAESYRVLTFRSREGPDFSYEDLADDVAALISANSDTRATIVGESFGGTVALSFALRHPSMVERLIIVNSFPRFHGRFRIRLARWLAETLPFGISWAARGGFSFLGLHMDGVSAEDRRRFFQAVRTVKKRAYARRLRLIASFDVEDRLSEIQAPTLFVAADKDLVVPSRAEAQVMAEKVPNGVVRVIKGAGHACLMGPKVSIADILKTWTQS